MLLGRAAAGSPPEHRVVPPGLGQRVLVRCTEELEGTWYPAKAGTPLLNAAGLGSVCEQGMKGWEHLVPPGDLISTWIPCLVRVARLYCPLRGSISPLVEKINPNPSYGSSNLCVSEFLNRFVSLSNRKKDLNVSEVVWCKVFTSS